MTRLLPDPELERLVRELNEREAAADGERSQWPAAQVPSGNPLEALLIEVARRGASDLLLITGSQPAVRNHIRRDKMENLISEITLGKRQGMISLEDSLARLVRQGVITADDAKIRSARPDELESQLRSS